MNLPRRLLIVAGTRPELIKQAPLFLAAYPGSGWESRVCFTGQQRELGERIARDLALPFHDSLDLMRPGWRPEDFLAAAVTALTAIIQREQPHWVAVQGDTTSALAGALAGYYAQVPVVHIEAGLRTHDLRRPFPEEGHRQLISRVAAAHAAPTPGAAEHLRAEGIAEASILVSGNTGIDCLQHILERQRRSGSPPAELPLHLLAACRPAGQERLQQPLVLVTLHRRESFGAPLAAMCRAIRRLSATLPAATFVLPMHSNPNVADVVRAGLAGCANVILTSPPNYSSFAWLLDHATLVMTDSGGLQEEAPTLGKPVLVLREVTERPEAVAAGAALLVGCEEEVIFRQAIGLLQDPDRYQAMAQPRFPYGDGQAAQRILKWLATWPRDGSYAPNPTASLP